MLCAGQATQPGSQAAAGSSDAVLTQPGADTLDPLGINTGGPAQTLIHRAPAASDPPAGKAGSRQPEASAAAAKPAASAATGGFDAPEGSYADRESYDEAAERPLASQGSYGRDGYSYDSPTSSYDITDDLPSVPGGGGDSFNRSTSQQVDTAAKQVSSQLLICCSRVPACRTTTTAAFLMLTCAEHVQLLHNACSLHFSCAASYNWDFFPFAVSWLVVHLSLLLES